MFPFGAQLHRIVTFVGMSRRSVQRNMNVALRVCQSDSLPVVRYEP